jgi:peptide/nickel transport system substrate-binding protein
MSFINGTRRRVAAAIAGAAALGLLVSACSGTSGSSGSGGDSTLVAYTGQSGDYQINFNPFSPSRIGGLGTIFESLFFYNKAEVSEPVPLLGTEQSWNEDGTVLSVALRDRVEWSDGEPFTAEDVVFTFELLKDNPSINGSGFDGTVEAVDDTHVTFTFESPAYIKGPDIMGTPIVPEHLWRNVNPVEDVIEQPVGSGAYLLKEFRPQAFTLEANPDHWGGEPKLKQIRFVALSGNQAGADGIATGTIDWFTGPIPDIQNTNQNHPGYDAFTQWQSQMVLQRGFGLQRPTDRPRGPARPVLRDRPGAAELARVHGHGERGLAGVHSHAQPGPVRVRCRRGADCVDADPARYRGADPGRRRLAEGR